MPEFALPDLRRVELIALDTEENDEGLRAGLGSGWAWHGGWVCGTNIAWRQGDEIHARYIPIQHPDSDNFPREQVARWLKDHIAAGVRFVTLNGGFDWGWLRADLGVAMPPSEQLEEVGALATIVNENLRHYGLDALCKHYGLPGKDEALLREAVEAAGFAPKRKRLNLQEHIWQLPARLVAPYAKADPIATLALYDKLNPILDQEGTRSAYRLECDLLPVILEMRRRGVRINQSAAEQARDLCFNKRDDALTELSKELGVAISMDEINRNAWKAEIFKRHGISHKLTKKGNPSFAKGGGSNGWMIAHDHPLPRLISAAEKYHGAGHKFLEGHILQHIIAGRIYAELHSFKTEDSGTRSFRFSYSDPPLQQMVGKDAELAPLIRGVFESEEGEWWVDTDADQQEFRLLVNHAERHELPGARAAGDAYRNDEAADFHKIVMDMTGLDRKTAKSINFGKVYGAGMEKLAEMMGKELAEATALVRTYDRRLPFVSKLSRVCQKSGARLGYTELYDGARRHWNQWEVSGLEGKGVGPCGVEEAARRLADPEHPWYGRRPSLYKLYTALNAQLQGDGARHVKLWLRECWRHGIVPLLQLHDSLSCSFATREQADLVARLGCEAVKLTVPMRVKTTVGRNWGDAIHKWEDLPTATRTASPVVEAPKHDGCGSQPPVASSLPRKSSHRAVCLQLKRLGYDVMPLISGKGTPLKGWPTMPNDEAAIQTWPGHCTAVRLYGSELFVIDMDIHIAVVRDAILAWLTERWSAFMADCLRRHSGAVTLALIGRAATIRTHTVTARFAGAGTDPRGDLVEVFTGNDKRYVGVLGRHSMGRDYGYTGRSILDVPPGELPWFPDQDIPAMLAGIETIMAGSGLAMVDEPAHTRACRAKSVFDLEPDMVFTLSNNRTLTLGELEAFALAAPFSFKARNQKVVGYATLWDPTSDTPDRVSVLIGASGLCLHDFKTGITHRWKDRAPPPDPIAEHLNALKKNATFAWRTPS